MKFPEFIDLEFSARCNLRCGFCFGPVDDRTVPDLPLKFWETLLRALHQRGTRGIVVSGGEPTLYPHLPRLIRLAKSLRLKTVVSTHGRHTDRVLGIAKITDWIALPVDALNPEDVRALRGDAWGIEACCALADQIRLTTTARIKLGTVATRRNTDEVLRLAEYLNAIDAAALFDTWKIYEYTPRRKYAADRELYQMEPGQFDLLRLQIEHTGATTRLRTVFSSNRSRRSAYLFIYPDGTTAIPNQGEDFGDLVVGNAYVEGPEVLDRLADLNVANNAPNFLATYE